MSRSSDISDAPVSTGAAEIAPVLHKPVKFIHDLVAERFDVEYIYGFVMLGGL